MGLILIPLARFIWGGSGPNLHFKERRWFIDQKRFPVQTFLGLLEKFSTLFVGGANFWRQNFFNQEDFKILKYKPSQKTPQKKNLFC